MYYNGALVTQSDVQQGDWATSNPGRSYLSVIAKVTANGSLAIDLRGKTNQASGMVYTNRQLMILKVAS